MNVICRLLVAVLCVLLVEGKPRNCTTKTVSLPLYRLRPPGSLSVSSTVYAIDVLVGSQRFNLTLDNNAQSPVLFSKGCSFFHPGLPQAAEPRCSLDMHKDLARNLFDPAQSKTFNDTGRPFSGWGLHRHPYLVLDCEWYLGFLDANGTSYDAISGTRATETYSLVNWAGEHNVVENLMIPQVPFVLVNSTRFMVSYRWAGDGVFPLGYETGEVLPRILDGVGGKQEVTLWLNAAPETNDTLVPGGQITLGGKDTENCDSTWTKVASTNRDNWSVTIHSFNILLPSGEVLATGYDARDDIRAEISIASPLLTVPTDLHKQLVSELNATINEELALYTVSCYGHPKIPSIVINIGSGLDSIYYTITPEQLISREELPRPGTDHKQRVCALMIVPNWANDWIIGSQFLPKRCIHFDYANNWISFADPLNRD